MSDAICLDIPIPRSVQVLARRIPNQASTDESSAQIQRKIARLSNKLAVLSLEKLGLKHRRKEREIKQAKRLADGQNAEILVLLERPNTSHNYDGPFNELVQNSPSLQAADQLIRFATKGQHSIKSIPIYDIYSFVPKRAPLLERECLRTLEDMIRAKQPKVIICCTNTAVDWSICPSLKKIQRPAMSFGVGAYPFVRKEVVAGLETTIIDSYHPSFALYHRKCNANYRMLLVIHFVVAFLELHSPITTMPEWFSDLSREAREDGPLDRDAGYRLRRHSPANKHGLVQCSTRAYNILSKFVNVEFSFPENRAQICRYRWKLSVALGDAIRQWSDTIPSSENHGKDISNLILTWMEHFKHHKDHDEILKILYSMGIKQNLYVPERTPLSDEITSQNQTTYHNDIVATHESVTVSVVNQEGPDLPGPKTPEKDSQNLNVGNTLAGPSSTALTPSIAAIGSSKSTPTPNPVAGIPSTTLTPAFNSIGLRFSINNNSTQPSKTSNSVSIPTTSTSPTPSKRRIDYDADESSPPSKTPRLSSNPIPFPSSRQNTPSAHPHTFIFHDANEASSPSRQNTTFPSTTSNQTPISKPPLSTLPPSSPHLNIPGPSLYQNINTSPNPSKLSDPETPLFTSSPPVSPSICTNIFDDMDDLDELDELASPSRPPRWTMGSLGSGGG